MPASPSARFPTTAWSCLEAARDPEHPKFQIAFHRLIATYSPPVVRFLRKKYPSVTDLEGLTQQFFFDLLSKGLLAKADQSRGHFRYYLRKILERFAIDKIVRVPRKDQFEQHFVSLHSLMEESDRTYEARDKETPEEAFDREWKASLVRTVLHNLESHYTTALDPEERKDFQIFAMRYLRENDKERPTQEAVAEHFGISRDQVRSAVDRVKKRFESLLRQEIRDQVGPDVDIEEEMSKLLPMDWTRSRNHTISSPAPGGPTSDAVNRYGPSQKICNK